MKTVIAFVNDLHVGHPFAICPRQWTLHDGSVFRPNELQVVIRRHWRACWQRVNQSRRNGRLIVVVVGDAIEGLHHDTTQVITTRLDTQEQMAGAVLEEALQLARFKSGDEMRFVTGTPAHDGAGAQSLERVARQVLDLADAPGRVTLDRWRAEIDGLLFDVAHEPGSGPGNRTQTHGNAFQMWLKSLYYTALETGQPVPRFVIRAHHHTYLKREVHNLCGESVVTGYILPAWKLKDEYVYRRAAHALSSVGLLALTLHNGQVHETVHRIAIEQDRIEVL